MSMTRYPQMKPSGEDWIGDVPHSWSAIRGKMLFEIRKRIAGEDGHTVLSITQRGVEEKDILSGEGQLAADYSNYQHLRRGEFAMNQMDLLTGWVDISKFDGVTSPDYRVFALRAPDAHDPRFHLYTLQHCYSQRIFFAFGKGAAQLGRWRLPTSAFNQFRFPDPPLSEQQAIARFLDRETSKIDELIAAQEDLIRLLKEKRQAVISHAVTKGLDPNAPMKRSGIEWLGDIPAHWEIRTLNRVVRKFVDYRGATPTKVDSGVPLITATQIKNGRISHERDPVFISEEEYSTRMTRGLPETGDLVLTTEAPLGSAALIEHPRVAPGQRIILMKTKHEMRSSYLLKHFQSGFGQSELHTRSSGSTASGIRADRLRATNVLVPPVEEQEAIIRHIEKVTGSFDAALAEATSGIALLKERRAALISAAVTGKIDVRGEVELPEDEAIPA